MIEHTEQRAGQGGQRLLKIGEVAELTGFPTKTLRYYEERGLVEPADRTEAGYRLYGEEEIARLEFVKKAKLIGLTLEQITELVSMAAEGGRGRVLPRLEEVLDSRLRETERRMAELAEFREGLLYYKERLLETDPVQSCDSGNGASFCGCLDSVTEGRDAQGQLISLQSKQSRKNGESNA